MDRETQDCQKTVLIVEDNVLNLKLTRDLLQIDGFATIEATGGAEGVRLAGQHHPDVVIMDVQLPDFDGVEAVRRLRSDPETADLVVIAVTAYATAGDEPGLVAAGFDGYLAKPIEVAAFAETIRTFCERGPDPKFQKNSRRHDGSSASEV